MSIPLTNPGFETGDFTGWTTQNPAECVVQRATVNPVESGSTWAAEFTDNNVDTGGTAYQAFANGATFGTGQRIYARFYFLMHNIGGTNWDFGMLVLGNNSASMNGLDWRTDIPVSDQVIRIYNRTTNTESTIEGTFAIQYDTWYRGEFGIHISAAGSATGVAESRLFTMDGTQVDQVVWTGIDTSAGAGNVYGAVGVGPQGGVGNGPRTFQIYIDDVAVSPDGWIGPVQTQLGRSGWANDEHIWLGGDEY